MKNKLIDLNNHLFAQLERLGDETQTSEELEMEIKRSKAISSISSEVVKNASLALDAQKLKLDYGMRGELPEMIGIDKDA